MLQGVKLIGVRDKFRFKPDPAPNNVGGEAKPPV
jgi:hypothetical protein